MALEKLSLQKSLLYFESIHGRPVSIPWEDRLLFKLPITVYLSSEMTL